MREIITITFILFTINVFTQNLVPNPSFEDTVYCPYLTSQTDAVSDWYQPTTATSDYFNCNEVDFTGSCNVCVPSNVFGYQQPNTGLAYAGFIPLQGQIPNYREYIQAKLLQVLTQEKCYTVSFYFSSADLDFFNICGCNSLSQVIGVQFSNDSLLSNQYYNLPINSNYYVEDTTLVDSLNVDDWFYFEKQYYAKGDEEFITIGNFRPDSLTSFIDDGTIDSSLNILPKSYFFIDDVSVVPCEGNVGVNELNDNNQLIKIINVLGRETIPKKNMPLFYIYENGLVEKKIIIE
jgi:OOP family OmpA-OmpF porin|tara:strand:- start:152 stop:1027 length:876 start_codon:yes stop_codon:yes gene_type:complete